MAGWMDCGGRVQLERRSFLWIHPFLDGNGRVARLMSHALLRDIGIGSALWSVSRGLERNSGEYKRLLMAADQPRKSDLDGRGALSQDALIDFCRFFLETCLDQIRYMRELLDPSELQRRMELYVRDEESAERLPKRSFAVLREALLAGDLERGRVPLLIDTSESAVAVRVPDRCRGALVPKALSGDVMGKARKIPMKQSLCEGL
ncbi:MAG TPA: Fic family protein [Dyella sp.]|uniref:Fic family protein n=1 Tax=Dyella sp. TaxID=1869338 RepID=UPI002D767972|nr:Fic family protein [Dyella sp.]HET6554451.1 Fic family protein [Dyella sp.]